MVVFNVMSQEAGLLPRKIEKELRESTSEKPGLGNSAYNVSYSVEKSHTWPCGHMYQ